MQVNAYAAQTATSPIAAFQIERKSPSAHEVAIDIEYCGICHSDIHQARNEWQNTMFPCVPGHEIVGLVKEVGSAVTGFKPGDRVGVGCLVGSCRKCDSCKDDLENYCEGGFNPTYNGLQEDGKTPTFGGYSSHIVVDQDFVLRVPEGMDAAATAPLLCAGITTFSPLKHVGLAKGDRIAVVGLGGLGHMGVKIAASMGAEVTVFSRSPSKKADAERLGAHHFVLTTDADQMAKLAGHYDYILDTVSAKHDLTQLFSCLRREGTLIMVGASEHPLDLAVFPLIMGRRKLLGSLIGGIKETQEMLDHCAKHKIVSDIELIEPTQINEAYERTLKSDVKYRFVIDCKKM